MLKEQQKDDEFELFKGLYQELRRKSSLEKSLYALEYPKSSLKPEKS